MPVLNTLPIYPPPSGAADGISISGHSSAANDGTLIERGTISLQSESHPVEFRKVELLVLDEE